MARRDCMSNKCQRIIALHALAEICSILQIKENISIRHQTLTYAGRAWSLYISSQNYNIQEGTGKVIYKPSIFDEEQLHLKQDWLRSHKSAI